MAGLVGDGGSGFRGLASGMEGNKQKAGVTFHWSSRHDRRVASEVPPEGTELLIPWSCSFWEAESAAVEPDYVS